VPHSTNHFSGRRSSTSFALNLRQLAYLKIEVWEVGVVYMPLIPATQEKEVRRSQSKIGPRQK
jgi:hypothetical protein